MGQGQCPGACLYRVLPKLSLQGGFHDHGPVRLNGPALPAMSLPPRQDSSHPVTRPEPAQVPPRRGLAEVGVRHRPFCWLWGARGRQGQAGPRSAAVPALETVAVRSPQARVVQTLGAPPSQPVLLPGLCPSMLCPASADVTSSEGPSGSTCSPGA